MQFSHATSNELQVASCVVLQNFRIYLRFLPSQNSSVMMQNFRICLRGFSLKSCFFCQIFFLFIRDISEI